MARPEEVDHGHLHGKKVRLVLHKVDCDWWRRLQEHWTGKPCMMSDDDVRAAVVKHAADFGWANGDIGKVVMVSRFGDCGITKNLDATHGYTLRLLPECLEVVE